MDSANAIMNCYILKNFKLLIRSPLEVKSLHLLSTFGGCIFNGFGEKNIRKLPREILSVDLNNFL